MDYTSGPNGISHEVPISERGKQRTKGQRGGCDDGSRGWSDALLDGDHEPSNVGSLWKLERARYRFSPGASRRNTVLSTS